MKKWTSLNKTCVVGPARCRDSHGPGYLLINGLSSALVMVMVVVDTLAASCQPWLRLHGNITCCCAMGCSQKRKVSNSSKQEIIFVFERIIYGVSDDFMYWRNRSNPSLSLSSIPKVPNILSRLSFPRPKPSLNLQIIHAAFCSLPSDCARGFGLHTLGMNQPLKLKYWADDMRNENVPYLRLYINHISIHRYIYYRDIQ